MLSFPKLLRTQKSPFVIYPVAMYFLTVVIASLEYFLGLSKVKLPIVHLLSHTWLFATPWSAAHQASLSFTISWSLNFYYAPFCIARRKDHLNRILVQTHCWLFIIIAFSAISCGVNFKSFGIILLVMIQIHFFGTLSKVKPLPL